MTEYINIFKNLAIFEEYINEFEPDIVTNVTISKTDTKNASLDFIIRVKGNLNSYLVKVKMYNSGWDTLIFSIYGTMNNDPLISETHNLKGYLEHHQLKAIFSRVKEIEVMLTSIELSIESTRKNKPTIQIT